MSDMHGIAGNTNTLAGNVPPKADLGDLRGLASGIDGRIAPMINGGDFDGAKAYKDSKVGYSSTCSYFEQGVRVKSQPGKDKGQAVCPIGVSMSTLQFPKHEHGTGVGYRGCRSESAISCAWFGIKGVDFRVGVTSSWP